MSDIWTIGELAERAALALRASSDVAPGGNGRVRDVPGERLIRWYTTIGLVDPPLTRRGRIAQYGRRHLLQLVAVKRLQAAGHSIAQIQTALAGATDRMLETAAGLGGTAGPNTTARIEDAPLGGRLPKGGFTHDGDASFDATPLYDGARPRPAAPHKGERPAAGAEWTSGVAERGETWAGGGTARHGDGDGATRPVTAPQEGTAGMTPSTRPGAAARAPAGSAPPEEGGARADDTKSRRGRFWAERPGKGGTQTHEAPLAAGQRHEATGQPPEAITAAGQQQETADGGQQPWVAGAPDGGSARTDVSFVVTGIRLGEGVRLVLDTGRVPSEKDVQAVLAAAEPLLAVLEERELMPTTTG
jgi:DNA-binding transcriptional MerR regulator